MRTLLITIILAALLVASAQAQYYGGFYDDRSYADDVRSYESYERTYRVEDIQRDSSSSSSRYGGYSGYGGYYTPYGRNSDYSYNSDSSRNYRSSSVEKFDRYYSSRDYGRSTYVDNYRQHPYYAYDAYGNFHSKGFPYSGRVYY